MLLSEEAGNPVLPDARASAPVFIRTTSLEAQCRMRWASRAIECCRCEPQTSLVTEDAHRVVHRTGEVRVSDSSSLAAVHSTQGTHHEKSFPSPRGLDCRLCGLCFRSGFKWRNQQHRPGACCRGRTACCRTAGKFPCGRTCTRHDPTHDASSFEQAPCQASWEAPRKTSRHEASRCTHRRQVS
jgi:hypothetical protein